MSPYTHRYVYIYIYVKIHSHQRSVGKNKKEKNNSNTNHNNNNNNNNNNSEYLPTSRFHYVRWILYWPLHQILWWSFLIPGLFPTPS